MRLLVARSRDGSRELLADSVPLVAGAIAFSARVVAFLASGVVFLARNIALPASDVTFMASGISFLARVFEHVLAVDQRLEPPLLPLRLGDVSSSAFSPAYRKNTYILFLESVRLERLRVVEIE